MRNCSALLSVSVWTIRRIFHDFARIQERLAGGFQSPEFATMLVTGHCAIGRVDLCRTSYGQKIVKQK